jgi:hydroxymethylbilane synthase
VTEGDRRLDVALEEIGGKGLFTRAIEERLLDGTIDLAVHSLKDLPTALPEGLGLAVYLERESPLDVLVSHDGASLAALPAGARIGAGGLRRAAQLRRARPDLAPCGIRGNVDTRLAKLAAGEYDAIILAEAGLRRLGLAARITERLGAWYHAVGQGIIAIETRLGDAATAAIVSKLDHARSRAEALAERAFLRRIEGGCQVPAGARVSWNGEHLRIEAMIADPEGESFLVAAMTGPVAEAESIGIQVAEELLARGGGELLGRIMKDE